MFQKTFLSPQVKRKEKEKFLENQLHNILTLFNVLQSFPFTTCEAMSSYYLLTWYIQIASRVAEQLKTQDLRKLGNIRKVPKLQRMKGQCPGTLTKDKVRQHQKKSPEKQQLNFSGSVLFFMKTRASLKYVVTDCLRKTFLHATLSQTR